MVMSGEMKHRPLRIKRNLILQEFTEAGERWGQGAAESQEWPAKHQAGPFERNEDPVA